MVESQDSSTGSEAGAHHDCDSDDDDDDPGMQRRGENMIEKSREHVTAGPAQDSLP